MSEKALQSSSQSGLTTEGRQAAVEAVLNHWFPLRSVYQSLQLLPKVLASSRPDLADAYKNVPVPEYVQQVEAKRAELLSLAEPQLLALYQAAMDAKREQEQRWAAERQAKREAKAAAQEAGRFYNLPNATADLAFWTKMEYWSFEESIALLLNKNPKAVTWKAVQREISPSFLDTPKGASAFLENYIRLWELGRRATAMQPPKLRPADVVAWARGVAVVSIPTELDLAFPGAASVAAVVSPESSRAVQRVATASTGTGRRWDAGELQELQEYRDKNGTKAAAERFGISTTRVRQLLPRAPASPRANDLFGRTTKRR